MRLTIFNMPPPASSLYLTSAMSGSTPVVSQSIRKAMVPVGASTGAAFVAVVRQAVAHDERAEVCITEAKCSKTVRVFRNRRGGIARIIHNDFLCGDEKANRCFKAVDLEPAVLAFELHQVKRG